LKVATDVRNRFDGKKRNPFNEAECGNHYARAMAAWSTLLAYSEFNYSGVTKSFSITSRPGNYFWSNGYSWGNAEIHSDSKEVQVKISVGYGSLVIKSLEVKGVGKENLKESFMIRAGEVKAFSVNLNAR